MSRDLVVESVRQAAEHGDGITLDAAEVLDLHQELSRLYGTRVEPQRTGADRLTGGLIVDIGQTLERHGYRRAEGPSAMAEFALAVVRLARAFEGEGER